MPDESVELSFTGEPKTKTEKKTIYWQKREEIRYIIKNEKDPEKRWGAIYELFVKEELERGREKRNIGEIEKFFRKTIELMYANAESYVGKSEGHRPGRPDGIEVGFQDGKVIIEIIEMKSSYYAYEHGRDSEQPKRTLDTLISIVKIINLISAGKGNMWILDELPNVPRDKKEMARWKEQINEIRKSMQKVRASEKNNLPEIDLSESISYRIITPSDENMFGFEAQTISDSSGRHRVSTTNEKSMLSKNDLHKIIETNLEQISD